MKKIFVISGEENTDSVRIGTKLKNHPDGLNMYKISPMQLENVEEPEDVNVFISPSLKNNGRFIQKIESEDVVYNINTEGLDWYYDENKNQFIIYLPQEDYDFITAEKNGTLENSSSEDKQFIYIQLKAIQVLKQFAREILK